MAVTFVKIFILKKKVLNEMYCDPVHINYDICLQFACLEKITNLLTISNTRHGHVGFVVDKVALGQVFSEYFGFSCQFSFHQLLHNHHHLSSGAGTIGQ
jgi:hypothetical protein